MIVKTNGSFAALVIILSCVAATSSQPEEPLHAREQAEMRLQGESVPGLVKTTAESNKEK